jgi:hypothetical protein
MHEHYPELKLIIYISVSNILPGIGRICTRLGLIPCTENALLGGKELLMFFWVRTSGVVLTCFSISKEYL